MIGDRLMRGNAVDFFMLRYFLSHQHLKLRVNATIQQASISPKYIQSKLDIFDIIGDTANSTLSLQYSAGR